MNDDDQTRTPGPDASPPPPRRRLPGGRGWWRLAAATASVGALVWTATAWQGGLDLGGGVRTDGGDGAAGTADPGTTGSAAGAAALVEAAALACPGPGLMGGAGGAAGSDARPGAPQRAEVLAALAPDDLGPSGRAQDGGAARLLRTGETGRTQDVGVDGPAAALTVDEGTGALVLADGVAAPGVVGGQLTVSTEPGGRGVSLAACTSPGETQWLVGGGDGPGRTEQLVLTNPGDDAVTVEVDVWGAQGPVPTTSTSAVVVPPRGRTVQLLDALAGPVEAPVVRVRATGGPVVAHLGEHRRDGTTELGAELVGAAAAPASDLVVPVVHADDAQADDVQTDDVPDDDDPDDDGPRTGDAPTADGTAATGDEGPEGGAAATERPTSRVVTGVTLRLAAPGDRGAVVDLTALTTDGAVRLASQVTRVPAGRTVDVVLEDLPDGALALRIRSDTPVTGGARLELAPSGEDPLPADEAAATEPAVKGSGDVPASTSGTVDTSAATDGPDGDGAGVTAGPDDGPPPLVRPAGEVAWVAATAPTTGPLGLALPARDGVPDARAVLAVSVVDATEVTAHLLDTDGAVRRHELGRLPNDTTALLEVPADVRAVWVTSAGPAGVVASVVLTGADRGGPYAAAVTLPAVPWARPTTEVTVVRP